MDDKKCPYRDYNVNKREMELLSPREILEWAYQRFGNVPWVACSFGKDSMVLLGLLRELDILEESKVLWINTGYDFAETLEFKDRIQKEWKLRLYTAAPRHTREEFEKEHGTELHRTDPSLCCRLNKVQPLSNFFAEHDVYTWISALRRDESPARAKIQILEYERDGRRLKINPLVNWTHDDVWDYLKSNNTPYNPLYDQGYRSLGCEPCSKAGVVGRFEETSEREGRWTGTEKEGGECGIHTEL
jgi:phosphoadenosine phosphosulfate reductase